MSRSYTIFKNLSYLLFANFILKIGSLITVIYITRILEPEFFGKLNYVIAFTGYFAVIAEFGISPISSRNYAQNQKDKNIINSTLTLKLLFSIISYSLIFFSLNFINKDKITEFLILLYGLTLFTSSTFNLSWYFQAIEEMKYTAYSLIIQSLIYIISIFMLVKNSKDIIHIPVILFTAQFISDIYQFAMLFKLEKKIKLKIHIKNFTSNIKESFPLFINHIITIISQNTPVLLISHFLGDIKLGLYSACIRISYTIWDIINNYIGVIFPVISKLYKEDKEKLNKLINFTLKILNIILLPLLTFIAIFSYAIVEILYGDKFISSYFVLKIVIFLPATMFLDWLFMNILIASHRQKYVSIIRTVTVLIMITLLYLTSHKGLNIISLIIVLAPILSAFIEYLYSKDFIHINLKEIIIKPFLSIMFVSLIIYNLKNYNLFLAAFIYLIIYGFTIYKFKALNKEEISILKTLIQKVKNRIKFSNPDTQNIT